MKLKKQSSEQWLGTLGLVLAAAVFFATSYFWEDVSGVLESLGLDVETGAAGTKQRKLVGAVLAFTVLALLLGAQFLVKRRRAKS